MSCDFGAIRINKNKVMYFVYVCYEAYEARMQAVRQDANYYRATVTEPKPSHSFVIVL